MSAAGAIAVMSAAHQTAMAPACTSGCFSTPMELAIVIAFIVLGVVFIFFIPWLFIRKQ